MVKSPLLGRWRAPFNDIKNHWLLWLIPHLNFTTFMSQLFSFICVLVYVLYQNLTEVEDNFTGGKKTFKRQVDGTDNYGKKNPLPVR